MSLLDQLNQLVKPIKRFVKKSAFNEFFKQELATISFTEQQSGDKIQLSVDYVQERDIAYLFFKQVDYRWKDLAKGSPVCIAMQNVRYSGWAEDLTGYEEFLAILNKNPQKRSDLESTYGQFDDENFQGTKSYRDFIEDYKLIRVKISH